MREVDVRALGWVITRDLWAEGIRVATGLPQRATPDALAELRHRWTVLRESLIRDRHRSFDALLRGPVATMLSKRSERAIADFARQLLATYPKLYSNVALRMRCRTALGVACSFALFGWMLALWSGRDVPLLIDASFIAFLIASIELFSAMQLRRVWQLLQRLDVEHAASRLRPPDAD